MKIAGAKISLHCPMVKEKEWRYPGLFYCVTVITYDTIIQKWKKGPHKKSRVYENRNTIHFEHDLVQLWPIYHYSLFKE